MQPFQLGRIVGTFLVPRVARYARIGNVVVGIGMLTTILVLLIVITPNVWLLGLVLAAQFLVSAVILWNTVYLAEAVELLKQQGMTMNEELLKHLSPLGWEHINLAGDYLWNMKQTPTSGQLRSLRLKVK